MNIEHSKEVGTFSEETIDRFWVSIVTLLREIPFLWELYGEQWIYEQAKMGHLQIWGFSDTIIRGIVVTRIVVLPKAKVFEILGAAGVGLLQFLEEINARIEWLAQDSGCDFMHALVRPGFEKRLKGKYSAKTATLLTRRITKRSVQ